MGSLVAPNGKRTQSDGETSDLLLTAHFPVSNVTEKVAVPASACRCNRFDWRVAAKLVTYQRVGWAINSFAPYKSPGIDGVFPALLQKGQEIHIPYLIRIFRACLATGFVPAIWR
jgi:hypothetical protein